MLCLTPVQHFLKRMRRAGTAALAVVLIAMISLLTAGATSASLHQRLHGDDYDAGHACILCMMIHGHMDCAAPAAVRDGFVAIVTSFASPAASAATPRVDLRLSPSRAPPLL
jgi:hypothetical protein